MRVSDISKDRVFSVPKESSIAECAKIMSREHVGDLVVTESAGGRVMPVGILTDRDIVVKVIARDRDFKNVKAGDLVGRELLTARQSDGLDDVLGVMRRHGVNRIPVLDEDGLLVGILTASDILKALAREMGGLATMSEAQHHHEMRVLGELVP